MGTDRWVAVEGGSNVRDLGGLALTGGGTTAYGVLFRSDTPQELTAADVAAWRERGLALVVDLRAPTEAKQEGRGPLDGVAYLNCPLVPDEAMLPGDDEEVLVRDRDREDRVGHYLGYLRGKGGRQLARAVTALTETTPALFHCAAGKDRTGVLAAVLLELAGVEREAVVADYALTSQRIDAITDRLARLPSYAADLQGVDRRQLRAEPEVMRGLLAEIDTRFGGVAAWLTGAGVPAEALARLRGRLRGES